MLIRFGITLVMFYILGCVSFSAFKATNQMCPDQSKKLKFKIEKYINGDLFCKE